MSGPSPTTPAAATPPPSLDVSAWVSSSDGTIPLVILVPHGGDLEPAELPDRICAACVTAKDLNTRELAQEISDAFQRRIGARPYIVTNLLHRRKFDANRDRDEAVGGYAPLGPVWDLFQLRVDSARARAARTHARALLIDLHGHAHAVARLELGYLLSAASLRLADSALSPLVAVSSVAGISAAPGSQDRGATLIRGPRSLGTRFADGGYPSVPSASDPAPLAGQSFFDGGYNTQRNGSRSGGVVDAVQLECNFAGVRDTESSRRDFAEAAVTALLAYLGDQFGWTAP